MDSEIFKYFPFSETDPKFPRKVYRSHRRVIERLRLSNAEIKLADLLNVTYRWEEDSIKLCVGLLGELFRQDVSFRHAQSLIILGEDIGIDDVKKEVVNACFNAYNSRRTSTVRLTLALCADVDRSWRKHNIDLCNCMDLLYREDTEIEDIYMSPLFETLTLCTFYMSSSPYEDQT